MPIDIRQAGTDDRLVVTDQLARKQIALEFAEAVTPDQADTDGFAYPVDEAVRLEAESLAVVNGGSATVMDESGTVIATLHTDSWTERIPPGRYYLDVSSQVKTYLFVDAPEGIRFDWTDDYSRLTVDFGRAVEVRIGARSTHERPPAKIVTPSTPADVMTAVSYFGAALKDVGPMRSFPNLRGHPPELELGDELVIPDSLDEPDTGVRLELPPAYEYVFPAVSLAYYLGATVEPADDPRLVTASGFTYDLDGPNGFTASVEQVLKQVFTADCFVRAGGPFSYGLARSQAFRDATGLDPEELYSQSLADQVEAYLAVPFDTVEPFVPTWGTGAHLEPVPSSLEFLPFLARELAIIHQPSVRRTGPPAPSETSPSVAVPEGDFTRGASAAGRSTQSGEPTETPDGPSIDFDGIGVRPDSGDDQFLPWPSTSPPMVWPEPLAVQNQLWIAQGIPVGADKPQLSAYQNGIDREPADGSIEIVVVCNDNRMAAEDQAVRELLSASTPFDVRIRPYRNLHREELRLVLERGADFLHFIGHIGDDGFDCPDGALDASSLEDVAVDAFFLNACSSYDQGRHLIDAGSIAGVVTLEDVGNAHAVRTGRLLSRLLNNGFPLNTALRIASEENDFGGRYTVVGDGGIQVAQAESMPHMVTARPTDTGEYDYRIESFATPRNGLGGATAPTIDGIDGWYLVGDEAAGTVTHDALAEALRFEDMPVRFNGEFAWSTDLAERLDRLGSCETLLWKSADIAKRLASMEEADQPEAYRTARGRFEDVHREFIDLVDGFENEDFATAYRVLLGSSG